MNLQNDLSIPTLDDPQVESDGQTSFRVKQISERVERLFHDNKDVKVGQLNIKLKNIFIKDCIKTIVDMLDNIDSHVPQRILSFTLLMVCLPTLTISRA